MSREGGPAGYRRCEHGVDVRHTCGFCDCSSAGDGLGGTASFVQAGLDSARQSLFVVEGAKLADSEELLAAVQGPAVKAVLEARIEQIVTHGHSAETDRLQPIGMIVSEARRRAQMAIDCTWGEKRNLPVARRRLAISAALLLAAIDRLDFEAELEPKGDAA